MAEPFGNSWAVTPNVAGNPTLLLNAQTVGAAGPVTLLQTTTTVNDCGYQLIFTSVGNSSGMTYTIVGSTPGQVNGTTTEVVTGPNATTANSVNYYSNIISITASGAATGNQSIGITGNLALPRCRIRGVNMVGASTAGTVDVTMLGSGKDILHLDTPATTAFSNFVDCSEIQVASSIVGDYAIVTLGVITHVTFICA